MPPVKDQGICGSCWAFSATSTVEYYNCKRFQRLARLSEQNLVDCNDVNNNCFGGFYTGAWDYIRNLGQCRESTYAYESGESGLPESCKRSICNIGGYVRSYKAIESDAVAMADIVANVGPISVAIDASLSSYDFYSSGVYRDPKCTKNVNHAMVIVGYGKTSDGIDYWIVRNSWGKWWGEEGYMLIERGVNMCGIEEYPFYPLL